MNKKNLKIFFLIILSKFLNLFIKKIKCRKVDNKVVTSELKNKILTTLFLSNEEINQKI